MPGIFIGARVDKTSARVIQDYLKSLNMPADIKLLPTVEYHCSIVYSKTPLLVDYPLDTSNSLANVFDLRYIGNALALMMESPWLRWRQQLARCCGYRSKFPGFIGHLSVVYDPPGNLPIAWWPKPKFIVQLTGEYQEPLKDK